MTANQSAPLLPATIALLLLGGAVACTVTVTPGPSQFQSSSGRPQVRLDLSDAGRTVGIAVGQVFTITLPSAGPGDWVISSLPDAAIASPFSSGFTSGPQGGLQVFGFQAVAAGTTSLQLSASGQSPFMVTVSVT